MDTTTARDLSSTADSLKKRKRYVSRACTVCRKRRMKCDGQPRCNTCTLYEETCIYDPDRDGRKPATKQYVEGLENRVRELEEMLELRHSGTSKSDSTASFSHEQDLVGKAGTTVSGSLRVINHTLTHHGPSSAYMLLPDSDDFVETGHISTPLATPTTSTINGSSAAGSPHNFDLSSVPWDRHLPTGIITDALVHEEVLDIFFCYLNDWCYFTDESAFMDGLIASVTSSDALTRNALYSPLLHNCILAFTIARYPLHFFTEQLPDASRSAAAAFSQKARWLIEEEASKPMISTAKALMLLGSYYSVTGSLSLGWLYEGMGVRMAQTMGLNADCSSLVARGIISEEMQNLRDSCLWTIFVQDQIWALSVGRTAGMTQDDFETPLPRISPEIDARPWLTHEARRSGRRGDRPSKASMTPSWASTTFQWTCKLFLLADRMRQTLYRMRSHHDEDEAARRRLVSELHLELGTWLINLPSPLRTESPRAYCPPPHIITMHATFRYLQILLHRPKYTQPHSNGDADRELAVKTCNVAAQEILNLLDLYETCPGLRFSSSGLINIVFAAGTIHLLDGVQPALSSTRNHGISRAGRCIECLRKMEWPSALAGAEILQQMLDEWGPTSEANGNQSPSQVSDVDGSFASVGKRPPTEESHPEPMAEDMSRIDLSLTFDLDVFQLAPFIFHDWGGS